MRKTGLVLALIALIGLRAYADSHYVLRDAALFGRFETLQARIEMEIHDRGVKARTIELSVEQGEHGHKALAHVVAPAFLSRMKYLTIGSENRTDQWIATSRGVRRLAGSAREERLFDSDFVVDDFTPPREDEYEVRELPDRELDGELCRVLEVLPRGISTGYARRVVFVSAADRILVRAEYYSASDELVRLFELHERTTVDGEPFPRRATMQTVSSGTSTEIVLGEITTDEPIPARVFNRGNL
ncbi:MAG: outer membrane lipoprotein-sorting protein [Spirochaetota bacterium]